MSPNKTLYIRDEDTDAWERAEAASHAAHQSLSQYVTNLIRRYVPAASPNGSGLEKITVDVGDGDRMWTEGFTGRWLAWDEAATGEWKQGIGLTQRGQFVWYEGVPLTNQGQLTAYASLEDLEAFVIERYWPDGEDASSEHQLQGLANFRRMIAEAAEEIGQEHVIWRDI